MTRTYTFTFTYGAFKAHYEGLKNSRRIFESAILPDEKTISPQARRRTNSPRIRCNRFAYAGAVDISTGVVRGFAVPAISFAASARVV